MRILLSCLQDLRPHPIPAYLFWADYLRNGIHEAGHDWAEVPGVDWAEGITRLSPEKLHAWRDRTWSKTLRWIKDEKTQGRPVDLFLSYLYPDQIETGALEEIRRQGVPCVNFFCDNVREFTTVPKTYFHFDLHWVPEFEAIGMYQRSGLAVFHAPMPVWIPPHLRNVPDQESMGATFIGSHDAFRQDLLGQAIAKGAPIRIFGRGWRQTEVEQSTPDPVRQRKRWTTRFRNQALFIRQHGISQWINKVRGNSLPLKLATVSELLVTPFISGEDYCRFTRESKVTLGINRVPTFRATWRHPITYSRLRDIEAPMLGACYLTEWTRGLDQYYDLGSEIETYRSPDEMVCKIAELQADPAKRQRLRQAGQRRALTDLSVAKSIQKMCNFLRLN